VTRTAFLLTAGLMLATPMLVAPNARAQSSVSVDPRLASFGLPAAPSDGDRAAVLKVLRETPVMCRVGEDPARLVPPSTYFRNAMAKRQLRGNWVPALAHILMTERALPMQSMQIGIDVLVRANAPESDRWAATIYRAAPILADRFVEDWVSAADQPTATRTHRATIEHAVESATARWKNTAITRDRTATNDAQPVAERGHASNGRRTRMESVRVRRAGRGAVAAGLPSSACMRARVPGVRANPDGPVRPRGDDVDLGGRGDGADDACRGTARSQRLGLACLPRDLALDCRRLRVDLRGGRSGPAEACTGVLLGRGCPPRGLEEPGSPRT
jgi:hypothetical protein